MSMLLKILRETQYKPPAILSVSLERKLKAAKLWLDVGYIYHPEYVYNPKHRMYNEDICNRTSRCATETESSSEFSSVRVPASGVKSLLSSDVRINRKSG